MLKLNQHIHILDKTGASLGQSNEPQSAGLSFLLTPWHTDNVILQTALYLQVQGIGTWMYWGRKERHRNVYIILWNVHYKCMKSITRRIWLSWDHKECPMKMCASTCIHAHAYTLSQMHARRYLHTHAHTRIQHYYHTYILRQHKDIILNTANLTNPTPYAVLMLCPSLKFCLH